MRSRLSAFASIVVLASPAVAHAATYTYSPPASGTNPRLWRDPTQWSPIGVPGAADTAIVALDPQDTGLSLQADGVTVLNLTLSGPIHGDLEGSGVTIPAGGAFDWKSGVVSLPITIASGATMTIETGVHALDSSTLLNQGTAIFTSGSLLGDGNAVLRNTGTFTLTTGATSFGYNSGLDTCDLYNTGTLVVSGPGTTTNGAGVWGFHNAGTVQFTGGGVLEWQTSSNTQHTLDDGGQITGNGTLRFGEESAVQPASVLTVTGTTTVATGATLEIAPGALVNAGSSGGILSGPGALVWSGGQIAGGAVDNSGPTLTWSNNLPVHMTGPAAKDMSTAYVVSHANVLWDQGVFGVGSDSYFTNTGTFTAQGDLSMRGFPNGYATFENRGTFTKASGTGVLAIKDTAVLNYGTLAGASGTIALTSTEIGPNVLESGSTVSGNVAAYCEVSLNGTSTVTGGSTLEMGNDGLGDQGKLDGSGTLGGAGTVKLDGAVVSVIAHAAIDFPVGGNVSFTANPAVTTFFVDPQGSLTLAGTTRWTAGNLAIEDGTVTSSGTFTASTPGSFSKNSTSALFSNTGTFTADPGASSTLRMGVPTTSSGTVVLKSGNTLFDFAGYVQTAGTTTLAGGNLGANDGATPVGTYYVVDVRGGTLGGSGTIDAILTAEGTVSPGTATAAGTLSVTQSYTQSSTGSLAIGLGGTTAGSQFDVLAVGGAVALGGALRVSLLGGYVPSVGATYKVVTSASATADTGAFGIVADPTGVTLTTSYDAEDVTLGVTDVSLPDGGAADAGRGADASSDGSVDAGRKDAGQGEAGGTDAASQETGAADARADSRRGHEAGSPSTAGDASADDAGTLSGAATGCSCGVGSQRAPKGLGLLGLAGLLVGVRRRRVTRAA